MNKIANLLIIVFFSFVVLSCQESNTQTASESINTLPALTPPQALHEITTSTVLPATSTLDMLVVESNFASSLDGHLYIGPSDNNFYTEFDFVGNRTIKYQIPKNCRLMPSGGIAICEVKPDVNTTEIYVYDMVTRQTDFFVKENVVRWGVSGDGNILLCITLDPNEHMASVLLYNFETKTQQNVGFLEGGKGVNLPFFTLASSDFLVGINYEREEWVIAELSKTKASALNFKTINVVENIAAYVYTEWSPNQEMAALVGFYRSDERPHVGTLQCLRIVAVYDPYKQNTVSTAKAPDGRCFSIFFFTQAVVWSPDSSKFVLSLDKQDMCIIDVSNPEQECVPVSIPHKAGYELRSLSWSPDSNYIAYYYI